MRDGIETVLWPAGAPAAMGDAELDRPSLTCWQPRPSRNNGAAVLVVPGGGYGNLAAGHEGRDIAKWLTLRGFTAYMLKYRLGPRYSHPAPLQDVVRAMRTVRGRCAADGKPLHKTCGVWGFSAGGHLAATLCTHWDEGAVDAGDAIERASCRPDFAILCYPVITMDDTHAHSGSKRNLLGESPAPDLVQALSLDLHVDARTPPTFIFATDEDVAVPAEHAVLYYLALRRAGVPAELHIYERGPHGVGLAAGDAVLSSWPQRLVDWFRVRAITA